MGAHATPWERTFNGEVVAVHLASLALCENGYLMRVGAVRGSMPFLAAIVTDEFPVEESSNIICHCQVHRLGEFMPLKVLSQNLDDRILAFITGSGVRIAFLLLLEESLLDFFQAIFVPNDDGAIPASREGDIRAPVILNEPGLAFPSAGDDQIDNHDTLLGALGIVDGLRSQILEFLMLIHYTRVGPSLPVVGRQDCDVGHTASSVGNEFSNDA